jgi:hypothetical protein
MGSFPGATWQIACHILAMAACALLPNLTPKEGEMTDTVVPTP